MSFTFFVRWSNFYFSLIEGFLNSDSKLIMTKKKDEIYYSKYITPLYLKKNYTNNSFVTILLQNNDAVKIYVSISLLITAQQNTKWIVSLNL